VRVWLAQDRLNETLEWVQQRGLDPDTQPTYVGALEYITLARTLVAQERYDHATRLLERLLEPAEAGAHITRAIKILMLQALAFQAEGELAQAMAPLERALNLAEPGGFFRIFVDESPPMARLLYEAVTRGIAGHGPAAQYARRLLAAFPVAESEQTAPSRKQAPPNLN